MQAAVVAPMFIELGLVHLYVNNLTVIKSKNSQALNERQHIPVRS